MSGMVLNFKRQFQPMVLDGSKHHTIRGERADGRRPQPGDMLHLWTGLRTKSSEFILRAPCIRTESISIEIDGASPMVTIGEDSMSPGNRLDHVEADMLAWADGFRFDDQMGDKSAGCFGLMMAYWQGQLPFRGWITHWDFSKAEFTR